MVKPTLVSSGGASHLIATTAVLVMRLEDSASAQSSTMETDANSLNASHSLAQCSANQILRHAARVGNAYAGAASASASLISKAVGVSIESALNHVLVKRMENVIFKTAHAHAQQSIQATLVPSNGAPRTVMAKALVITLLVSVYAIVGTVAASVSRTNHAHLSW